MDSQQYSLSWNHFHSNLSIGFQSLLREQDLVDVTLAVDGKYFKAHKMVLSICSPYFKELFQVNPCKHPIVVLQDVQHRILKCLLVFMYQGEVKVCQNDLAAFMKLAEALKVKGLTDGGIPEENEKKPEAVYHKDKKETSTNGLFPASTQIDDRMSRSRPIRPKIVKPVEVDTLKAPPTVTPPSTSSLPNKRPKLEYGEDYDSSDFIEPQNNKKSKDAKLLALRLEALQAQQRLIAHQMMQKQEMKQKKLLTHAHTTPLPSSSSNVQNPRGDEHNLLVPLKEEPFDVDATQNDMILDMSSIVATSLGDESETEGALKTETGDAATPGRVMLLKSRRGLPVLIHDGHIYTKHKVEPTRTLWLCVKQRNLQCGGCLTTGITVQNVLSFSGHNHRQLHDIIKRLQTAGTALGSGSSNCGSSSNSSPSHSHDRHDFSLEPTDLSLPSTQSSQS